MTHKEAVEEMKRLAPPGKHWALMHEVASYHDVKIHGYIEDWLPNGHADSAKTYAEAIKNVKVMLGLTVSETDPAPEDKEAV